MQIDKQIHVKSVLHANLLTKIWCRIYQMPLISQIKSMQKISIIINHLGDFALHFHQDYRDGMMSLRDFSLGH